MGIRTTRWAAGVLTLAAIVAATQRAEAQTPAVPRASNAPDDQQIVAAMKRGVDFLMSQKADAAGDNWESGRNWIQQGQRGGETSLVLYALLHAGESLRDDPEYGPRLHHRSKEILPVVEFVQKVDPDETYTAALQASALALVPRDANAKGNQGPLEALKRAQRYLVGAMGVQGGYTYGPLGTTRRGGGFEEAWSRYFAEKSANRDPQAIAQAKARLDQVVRNLQASFGGAEFEISRHMGNLRQMQRENPGREMSAAVEAEIRELQRYEQGMPKSAGIDYAANLQRARANVERIRRSGRGRGLEEAEAELAAATANAQNRFFPIGDLSNAQFGALGMWALADAGLDVRVEYWQATDRFWRLLQRPDGSWPYAATPTTRDMPSEAMGVAGIATLFIAQEFVDRVLRTTPKPDKHLDMGLAWLNENFRADTGDYYYLYAVERVGLASGLKYFGTRDWYAEGAAHLLRAQRQNGSWAEADRGGFNRTSPVISTCFALLFLARGRNPIPFNKLQYNGPWNARPRDDAVLTRWMSKRFERPMNWQVVNLDVDPKGLMDAPVLLITGSRDPKFNDEEVAKLKGFVEAGGMIFSTADDGNAGFTESMKSYANQITGNRYAMRELEKTHAIYSRELGVESTTPPKLMGLSNGVREVWVHSPVDLGASWQMQRMATKEHFEVPAAIYLYATGKTGLRTKLKSLEVAEPEVAPARKVTLARVNYGKGFDPEPGAWPRFARRLRAQGMTGIDLQIQNVPGRNLDPVRHPIAHMTGAGAFTLAADEMDPMRAYLNGGGILLVDAAGGSAAFAESFSKMIATLFPGHSGLAPVGPDHALITGEFAAQAGPRVREIGFRKSGLLALGKNVEEPDLKMMQVNGKGAIVFSPYDITSGLLGTNTWGVVGYTPESAEKVAENLVRWALEAR